MIDIASLRPIMHSLFNKDSKAQGELGLLADSFFSARSAAMPPPDRPVRTPAQVNVDEDNGEEESQDYGVMDIDINWSSVDIPEALAVDNEEKSPSSNGSHDKTLVSVSNISCIFEQSLMHNLAFSDSRKSGLQVDHVSFSQTIPCTTTSVSFISNLCRTV